MELKKLLVAGVSVSSIAMGAAALPSSASAQASASSSSAAQLEEVIVTGSAREQRRFEVSYAANVLSQDTVEQMAPLNYADLLGKMPGIQAENSGGEVGNITRVRGIPTDDGSLMMQQDGLALFHDVLGISFKGDTMNRYDLMTERVELVRGGPAPIFVSQAAAVANTVTVTGSEVAAGKAQITLGSTDLYRADVVQSGPLGANTYYAVGGFLRRDGGHRDNGYPNDSGGQIRGNIKHDIGDGYVKVTGLYLNDHNTFYLPIPVADPRNPSVSLDPYIDYFDGTLNSPAFRNVNLKYLDGAGVLKSRNRDIANGRHLTLSNVGLQFEQGFEGWTVALKAGYTKGKLDFDAFYSTTNPADATTFANGFLTASRTAFGAGVARLGYAIAGTNGATVYNPAADSGLVMQGQYRAINVDFNSAQFDLSATRQFETGLGTHDVKVGIYGSSYGESLLSTYQDHLVQVRSQPQTLDLIAYSSTGAILGYVTDKGVLRYTTTLIGGSVDANVYAAYVNDTWDITDSLRLDAGIRSERYSYDGYSLLTAAANLGDATTLADDATRRFTGAFQNNSRKISTTSWTVGVNYDFTSSFGGYVRASHLESPPAASLNTQVDQVYIKTQANQYEAGLKVSLGRSYVYATYFSTKFDPFNATFVAFNPATGRSDQAVPFFGEVIAKGVEIDGALNLVPWFSLSGSLTVQDPHYANLSNTTGADSTRVNGKQIIREPKIYGNLRPSFNFDVGGNQVQVYGSYEYVGKRYVDFFNSTELPAYGNFDAGVTVSHGTWQAQLVGDNITNEEGLTEGNIRTDILSGQGSTTAVYGRPVFGRSVRLILSKSW